MYKEGRPCVHVRTCDRKQGSSQCDFGAWVGARVLLWRDQQRVLHVTVVKAVSKGLRPAIKHTPRHSQAPLAAVCRMAHASSSV